MPTKKSKDKDPYTSRNEFKKGFYDQADKPPVTEDTMYGIRKTTEPTYEVPEDTMNYSHGGSVMARGNKMAKSKPTKLY